MALQEAWVPIARAVACFLIVGCSGATALAKGAPSDSIPVLPPVVVTPSRAAQDPLVVPAAIDRIDSADLSRALPRLHLAESLPRIPGILARDRQNEAQDLQISIRGFGARSTFGVRGVRLYSDGIPATMPDGQGQVSHFMLDAADRIEVLRGPFSALYGNSSGGVIQIFSVEPPSAPEWRLAAVSGADARVRGSLGLRGPWSSSSGGYAIDVASTTSEGFREHSASRRTLAQALLRGSVSGAAWTLSMSGLDARAEDPQGLTADEWTREPRAASPGALAFDARKTTRQGQAGARLDRHMPGSSAVSLGGYAGSRAIVQILTVPVAAQSSPTSGGGVVDLDRRYYGWDARWRWTRTLGLRSLSITAGLERQVSDEHRLGFENFVGSRLGVRGALRRDEVDRVSGMDEYAQLEWQLADRWRLDAGARHSEVRFRSDDRYVTAENGDDSGSLAYRETKPVAGVLWRASSGVSLYANAGQGFETPTFAELAYRADGASGWNTALRPSRSDNLEVGLRARSGGQRWGLCGFVARTRDELVVASSQGGRTTFANAAETLRRGIEWSWSGGLSPHWRGAFAYTYLDATFRRPFGNVEEGNRIPGIPRHDVWGEWRWRSGPGLDVGLSGAVIDRVFANDGNSASAPGYALVDLSAETRHRIGGAEVVGFFRASNLLDRKAVGSVIVNEANGRSFEPAPGRGWFVGVNLRLMPGRFR